MQRCCTTVQQHVMYYQCPWLASYGLSEVLSQRGCAILCVSKGRTKLEGFVIIDTTSLGAGVCSCQHCLIIALAGRQPSVLCRSLLAGQTQYRILYTMLGST
jgi:hypothetical protein